MEKYIVLLLGLLTMSAEKGFSQVGAMGNKPDPSAALDLTATNKGLLIPRISLQNLTDQASIAGGNPATGLRVYNTNTALQGGVGHYYWDGTRWQKIMSMGDLNSVAWSVTGNAGTTAANYLGTSDATDLKIATNAQTNVIVSANGNIALAGNTAPHASAALDVSAASTRAITLPKVALTGTNDLTTVPSPQSGMMVYNTNSAHIAVFNGTQWTEIVNTASNLVTPQLVAQAKSIRTGSLSYGNVWYDTKVLDPENALVLGTGSAVATSMTYTVQKAGIHQVYVNYAAANTTAGASWYIQIKRNGVTIAEQDASATTTTAFTFAFAVEEFVPGDVITVYKAGAGSAWLANLSSIAIFRFQ